MLESQVSSMLETIEQRYADQGAALPPAEVMLEQVQESLIIEELQLQMGVQAGVRVGDGELNQAFEKIAKKRIKVGLILNEFGEQNKIKVTEQEVQAEVQKQLRMMPGQEKMVMEFYQKNPSALASLRGTVYEEKIIDLIKTKAKPSKKEISKEEAEKILKEHQKQDHNHEHDHDHDHDHPEEKKASKSAKIEKKPEPSASKKPSAKKVSKK